MSIGTVAVLAILLGLIPAVIASKKGQPFLIFWFLGALLFPVMLVVSILMPHVRRRCPFCREKVQDDASVCPHCQREMVTA